MEATFRVFTSDNVAFDFQLKWIKHCSRLKEQVANSPVQLEITAAQLSLLIERFEVRDKNDFVVLNKALVERNRQSNRAEDWEKASEAVDLDFFFNVVFPRFCLRLREIPNSREESMRRKKREGKREREKREEREEREHTCCSSDRWRYLQAQLVTLFGRFCLCPREFWACEDWRFYNISELGGGSRLSEILSNFVSSLSDDAHKRVDENRTDPTCKRQTGHVKCSVSCHKRLRTAIH